MYYQSFLIALMLGVMSAAAPVSALAEERPVEPAKPFNLLQNIRQVRDTAQSQPDVRTPSARGFGGAQRVRKAAEAPDPVMLRRQSDDTVRTRANVRKIQNDVGGRTDTQQRTARDVPEYARPAVMPPESERIKSHTTETPATKRLDARTERQERIDASRAKREALQEGRKGEMEERRAEREQRLEERQIARVKAYFLRVIRRLDAAIERFEGVVGRIESRIDKLEERGVDAAESREKLIIAREAIETAAAHLERAQNAADEVVATTDGRKVVFEAARETIADVITDIRTAHRALVETIVALKANVRTEATGSSANTE